MARQVQVCTAGECGGECYRCRLAACAKERGKYARMYLRLYDAGIVSGSFGPWSDHWTDEDRVMWDRIDDLRAELELSADPPAEVEK